MPQAGTEEWQAWDSIQTLFDPSRLPRLRPLLTGLRTPIFDKRFNQNMDQVALPSGLQDTVFRRVLQS